MHVAKINYQTPKVKQAPNNSSISLARPAFSRLLTPAEAQELRPFLNASPNGRKFYNWALRKFTPDGKDNFVAHKARELVQWLAMRAAKQFAARQNAVTKNGGTLTKGTA